LVFLGASAPRRFKLLFLGSTIPCFWETLLKRSTWLDLLAGEDGQDLALPAETRMLLSQLDDRMFEFWNLGENVFLAWCEEGDTIRLLVVPHYAIAEAIHSKSAPADGIIESNVFINGLLSNPKHLAPEEFQKAALALGGCVETIACRVGEAVSAELVDRLVNRYGISLVRGRAVVLLDAVGFSLHTPLEQVAMLNSLAYSVNSAYRQLLSKDIHINFARTTTGDGFYIWNRSRSVDANISLYKLMMLILADNAVAQRKARGAWVPRLRAAFHVGEHYEFYQVEALNPTTFSYIVGPVTIDLSRMIEQAMPNQILLGDFSIEMSHDGQLVEVDTLDFVARTAASLYQLRGLTIADDRIENIRCYLTGRRTDDGQYAVAPYRIHDKHGIARTVLNAKINIHREQASPIFLGVQNEDLSSLLYERVTERGTEATA
jgi:hypothetical protein